MSAYDASFYRMHTDASAKSARRIIPLVLAGRTVRSVVDVGCGMGAWLAEFAAAGVPSIQGYDGAYVDQGALRIPRDRFRATDLTHTVRQQERCDLAVSLEVAEHLPDWRARGFVQDLCELSDTVLFSAAIPGQGGTGHVNEQWPSYWSAFFASHGYGCLDIIRREVWTDPGVAWWYAQNTLLFVKGAPIVQPLSLVHPALYQRKKTLRMRLGEVKARFL